MAPYNLTTKTTLIFDHDGDPEQFQKYLENVLFKTTPEDPKVDPIKWLTEHIKKVEQLSWCQVESPNDPDWLDRLNDDVSSLCNTVMSDQD